MAKISADLSTHDLIGSCIVAQKDFAGYRGRSGPFGPKVEKSLKMSLKGLSGPKARKSATQSVEGGCVGRGLFVVSLENTKTTSNGVENEPRSANVQLFAFV